MSYEQKKTYLLCTHVDEDGWAFVMTKDEKFFVMRPPGMELKPVSRDHVSWQIAKGGFGYAREAVEFDTEEEIREYINEEVRKQRPMPTMTMEEIRAIFTRQLWSMSEEQRELLYSKMPDEEVVARIRKEVEEYGARKTTDNN